MPALQTSWDERHRAAAGQPLDPPASIVLQLLPMLRIAPVLDIACGRGRHTLLLAERGCPVAAVDASEIALEALEMHATEKGIRAQRSTTFGIIAPPQDGIATFRADLERVPLPKAAFQTILNTQYLQRSLFPQIESALCPGGLLIFETFTRDHVGHPSNPDYLLESGELRYAFPSLEVLFHREIRAGKGIASLVARKR